MAAGCEKWLLPLLPGKEHCPIAERPPCNLPGVWPHLVCTREAAALSSPNAQKAVTSRRARKRSRPEK